MLLILIRLENNGSQRSITLDALRGTDTTVLGATGIQDEQQLVADITMNVISQFTTPTITVEEIQDLVEKSLMKVRPEVANVIICPAGV